MTWLFLSIGAAVVAGALAVMGVLAERRPDPAPERDIGAVGLPAVRDEKTLRDKQFARQRERERARNNRYRNDRGDTP